jgi:hypothetical protein
VWPAKGKAPFSTPTGAALDFARAFLGMTAAVTDGESAPGTTTFVAVRPFAEASAVTNVATVRSGTGWVVVGATTNDIVLNDPATGAVVSSPLMVSGSAAAFESQIRIELRSAGSVTPIATTTAMGGPNGEMGPFTAGLTYSAPPGDGVLVVGADDASGHGDLSYATVVMVKLA